MQPYRVGLIGVGGMGIANYHAGAFAADPRAEIVACCDIDDDALEAFGERFSVSARFTDAEEMMRKAALDVVVVCTNETLHARMTCLAASYAPKAILCEKPMALTLDEADAMLDACAENDVLLAIGHQRRYNSQYALAKERLDAGAIGRLERVVATVHGGAALLVDGTHTVDLIRFFVGDVPAEWVFGAIEARSERVGWGHVLEDAAIALIGFEGGVRAHLSSGGNLTAAGTPLGDAAPFYYHRFILYGEEGRIEIAGDWEPERGTSTRLIRGDVVEKLPIERGWHRGLSPQSDLLNVLENGGTHPLSGESARATLEILLSIFESARQHAVIRLPLENRGNPLEQFLDERREGR